MSHPTQATNHPRKGSQLIIEPLRTLEQVVKVKAVLADEPRNLALFTLGINSNLRASDLLALKNSDIDWNRHEIIIREKKTGKSRHIAISPGVMAVLLPGKGEPDEYLFQSEKTGSKLEVAYLNQMIKSWMRRANIRGNFGSHSLRKTWATIQYTVFKVDLALISQELNHSSMRITYKYLGIMPENVRAIYMNEI